MPRTTSGRYFRPYSPLLETLHPARSRPAQPLPFRAGPRLAKRDAHQDGEFYREADREAHVRATHGGLGHQGGEGAAEQAAAAEARAETPGEAAETGRNVTIADRAISLKDYTRSLQSHITGDSRHIQVGRVSGV